MSKKNQNDSAEPKIGPKKPQNDPRSTPKRPHEDPKRAKKAIPNHKTTREPSQVDPKTVLDPPKGPEHRFARTPGGSFGRPNRHQNGTKNDPKTKRKIKRPKNRSKTILDPSWVDLGSFWVLSWGPGNAPDCTPAYVS